MNSHISVDTNVMVALFNSESAHHEKAREFFLENRENQNFVIAELALVELYGLLRNPAVMTTPLSAPSAVAICDRMRTNRNWRLVENAPIMNPVWEKMKEDGIARGKIFDVRLAYTLQHFGVTEFATANLKHFRDVGFQRVWNPLV